MIYPTPEIMEDLYEALRKTLPFRRWKLPHADEVEFSVMVSDKFQADYSFDKGRHHIRLSAKKHHTMQSIMATIAHEMCHLRQQMIGDRSHHGAPFQRMADQVCRHHVWDRGQF